MNTRSDKLLVGAFAFLLFACSDPPVAQLEPVEHSSIEEMNAALLEAGYTCSVDDGDPTPLFLQAGSCQWPRGLDPEGKFGFVSLLRFDSELARLRYLVLSFTFCLDIPDAPPGLPYAYGPEWAVDPEMCAVPAGGMSQIAEVLGGETNVADLTAYESEAAVDRLLEDGTVDELKEFLGESG